MKNLFNGVAALAVWFAAGTALASDPAPAAGVAARADLHPPVKSVAHYVENPNEARTVFALCSAGRVAAPNLQACANASEVVLAEVLQRLRNFGYCPIPVC